MTSIDGLLVVDKEAGWTSHDVVAKCRRIFGQRRVGHAGTLDPGATGVLVVGLGRVTRLMRFIGPLAKSYEAEVVFGVETTTLDASGEVVRTWDMSDLGPESVGAAARSLLGEIDQVPPMVSAVKVGGRRLHALAREGVEVDRAPRRVRVHELRVDPTGEPDVWRMTVVCSGGTYVRSLAADLGAGLGGGAHLRSLRRVAVGSFHEREARPVGGLDRGSLLEPSEALRDYAAFRVDGETARRIGYGAVLARGLFTLAGDGPWAVKDGAGRLLAVYEAAGAETLRPAVVLSS